MGMQTNSATQVQKRAREATADLYGSWGMKVHERQFDQLRTSCDSFVAKLLCMRSARSEMTAHSSAAGALLWRFNLAPLSTTAKCNQSRNSTGFTDPGNEVTSQQCKRRSSPMCLVTWLHAKRMRDKWYGGGGVNSAGIWEDGKFRNHHASTVDLIRSGMWWFSSSHEADDAEEAF